MIHYPFNFNSSLCHSNIPERIICITFGFHLMLFAKLVTPPYPTPPLPDSTSRAPARQSKQEQGGKLPGLTILIMGFQHFWSLQSFATRWASARCCWNRLPNIFIRSSPPKHWILLLRSHICPCHIFQNHAKRAN